jgi:multiple sugar transport system permease protein
MNRRRNRWADAGVNAALLLTALFFGAPFLWIAALAFDRGAGGAIPWPEEPTLDQFRYLFDELAVGRSLRNSLIVVGATTVLATVTAALAGYGLSRIGWRQKTAAAYGLLLLYTFPVSATMVPIYDLSRRLGLYNTYQGLIVAHTALVLPLLVWLMKGFFDAVPRSIEEAARLDGRSRLRAWAEVLVPLVKPGLAVVAGFAFLNAWAEVLLVIAMVRGTEHATIALRFMTATEQETIQATAAIGLHYIARRSITKSASTGPM